MAFTPNATPYYARAPLPVGPIAVPAAAKTVFSNDTNTAVLLPALPDNRQAVTALSVEVTANVSAGKLMLYALDRGYGLSGGQHRPRRPCANDDGRCDADHLHHPGIGADHRSRRGLAPDRHGGRPAGWLPHRERPRKAALMPGFFDDLAMPFGVPARADAAGSAGTSAIVARLLAFAGSATLRSYNVMADGSAVPGVPFTLIQTSLSGGNAAQMPTAAPVFFSASPDGNWLALWSSSANAGRKLQFYKRISPTSYQYAGDVPGSSGYEGVSFKGSQYRNGYFVSNTRFVFGTVWSCDLSGGVWGNFTNQSFAVGDYNSVSLSFSDDGSTTAAIGQAYTNDSLYSQIQAKYNGTVCTGSVGLGQSQYWANSDVFVSPLGTYIVAFMNRGNGDSTYCSIAKRTGTVLSGVTQLSGSGYPMGYPGRCEWISESQCVFGLTPYNQGAAFPAGMPISLTALYLNCATGSFKGADTYLFPPTAPPSNQSQFNLPGRMTDTLKIAPAQVLMVSEAMQLANLSIVDNAPVYNSAIAFPYPVALATAFLRS
ncbi:hypothetical protein [Methylobacterium sp. J-090]|uniref:hypothetical protein n=1 Tax=Methylobacterium sp. J-090 TaxID=2836666 RepID=UPI001FB95F84|nr:hypothetical protein [Methylobacterium sp. J-090]MCJ2080756.1 hypothetical protein [Methylobacterium sp. J-090]